MTYDNFGEELQPNKIKKNDNPLSTRKSGRQKYVCSCVRHCSLFPSQD